MSDNLKVARGRSRTFKLELLDEDDNFYSLAGDEKIIFGVKKNPAIDEDYVILKAVTSGTDGVYKFSISPADTIDLICGKYYYDIGLQSGAEYYPIIDTETFEVTQNVTEWGCAD